MFEEFNPLNDDVDVPAKFPEIFEIKKEIKAPTNVLWYNENTRYEDNYPAKMHPDFARDMIEWYSDEGDVVWDCFSGAGIVARTANKMNRIGIGTDINPKAIDLSQRHDPEHAANYFVGDVRTVKLYGHPKPKLCLCSPPFGISIAKDKNNYSDEPDDLSNSKSISEFLDKIRPAFKNIYDNLAPHGIFIFDARDRTRGAVYFDLIRHFANMAESVGFIVHSVYHFFKMPWNIYTVFQHENKKILPTVATIDVYVMYKPMNHTIYDYMQVGK